MGQTQSLSPNNVKEIVKKIERSSPIILSNKYDVKLITNLQLHNSILNSQSKTSSKKSFDEIFFCINDLTNKINNFEQYVLLYLKNFNIEKKQLTKHDNIKYIISLIKGINYTLFKLNKIFSDMKTISDKSLEYNYLLIEILFKSINSDSLFKQDNSEWELDLKSDETSKRLETIFLMLLYVYWLTNKVGKTYAKYKDWFGHYRSIPFKFYIFKDELDLKK